MPDGNTRKKIGDGTKKFSELPYDEITVDGVLSATSMNPIQNKAVKSALDGKAGTAVATQSANGLMSKSDKVKLDGITGQVTAENLNEPGHTTDLMQYGAFQVASKAGVQKILAEIPIVDTALDATSTNPVQNKAVKAALDNKANIDSPTFTSRMALKANNGGKIECVNASYMNEKGETFAGIQLSSQEGSSTGLVAIGGIKTPDPNADGSTDTAVSVAYLNEQLLLKANNTIVNKDKAGLMSASDKIKLDGIADGANKITIDTALSSTSTNPVQNKVITELLNEKIGSNKPVITEPEFLTKATLKSSNESSKVGVYADTTRYAGDKGEEIPGITLHGINRTYETNGAAIGGIITPDYNQNGRGDMAVSVDYLNKQLAVKADNIVVDKDKAGLMSASDKIKLDGIATGANKTTVDSALSASSMNPVQNKVIKSALDNKMDKSGGTFTGNVTGKYFCGTWLQSTQASDLGRTPSRIAVLDDSGWVYYRTSAEILNDIGGVSKLYVDSAITQKINGTY